MNHITDNAPSEDRTTEKDLNFLTNGLSSTESSGFAICGWRFLPRIVMSVPPARPPLFGETESIIGLGGLDELASIPRDDEAEDRDQKCEEPTHGRRHSWRSSSLCFRAVC